MLNPDEISSILSQEIDSFKEKFNVTECGVVTSAGDGVATVYGLSNVMAGELIEFENGVSGMALSLLSDSVGAIILGDASKVEEGDSVKRTGKIISIPVGDSILGRVVNPLGEPLDGKGPVNCKSFRPLEGSVPSVVERTPVKEPLQTGLKAIDAMIPIGRGQRELIIGDRGVGKTAIAIDAILNQKNSGVFCIYVAIGQKASTVAKIIDVLKSTGALNYTSVIYSGPTDSPSMQYLAPYAGCAMAEEFMYTGRHALIIYDDLSKHAVAYRQLSLLLRRPPGREAYPGDIFYIHSRLLERSAKLSQELGGGSLTALPIVETQAGDISSYIPTNIISITDGQIYLEADLFNAGVKPAVNVGLSVSRVGGSAQISAMKKVAGRLRLDLAQYRELEVFAQFSSDIDKNTQVQLNRGKRLIEVLKQDQYQPMHVVDQTFIIFAGTRGYLDDLKISDIARFESGFLSFIRGNFSDLHLRVEKTNKIDENDEAQLIKIISDFKKMFSEGTV